MILYKLSTFFGNECCLSCVKDVYNLHAVFKKKKKNLGTLYVSVIMAMLDMT